MNDNIRAFLQYLNARLPKSFETEPTLVVSLEATYDDQLVQAEGQQNELTTQYSKKNPKEAQSFSSDGCYPIDAAAFPKEKNRDVDVFIQLLKRGVEHNEQ